MTLKQLGLLALAIVGLAMAPPDTIAFIRPPGIVGENTGIPIKVRIPPHEDNRKVEIMAFDKADGERVSYTFRELTGSSAALLTVDVILPRGHLLLVGQLWGVHGARGKATAPIRVMGKWDDEGEPDDPFGEEFDAR